MALSNMFNEPRREIIETTVGFVTAGPVLYGIYYLDKVWADWFYVYCGASNDKCPYWLCLVLGPIFAFILFLLGWGLLALIHEVGEEVCGQLQDRGIRLRPLRNYERRPLSWEMVKTAPPEVPTFMPAMVATAAVMEWPTSTRIKEVSDEAGEG